MHFLLNKLRPAAAGVALAAVLTVTLPALAKDHPPPSGKVFRFRLPFEPSTLDWNLGDVPIPIIQNVMRGLFRVDTQGQVVPDLVESFESLEQGKRWVFRVRKDVNWSDGVALTAYHVVEGLRRLLSPQLASTYAYFLFDVQGARDHYAGRSSNLGIRATGEHELEITLQSPLAFLPAILTHWVTFPARGDLIEKHRDYWRNPERIATLGSFRIQSWVSNTRIVLIPNEHAKEKPWLQKVEAWVVLDDQTAVNMYDSGQLDFILDPGPAAAKRADLTQRPSPILYFVGIGPGHPFSNNSSALTALSIALNRTELPEALSAPHRPAASLVPPEIAPAPFGGPVRALESDIGRAQTLLATAGFKEPGKVPPLKLHFFNRPAMAELAQWIQAQWKKNLGLRVELESHETKSYWTQLAGRPQAFFINSKGAAYPDADAFFRVFTSDPSGKNPQNLGRWNDPTYDQHVKQGATALAPATRKGHYASAEARIIEGKPALIPLYFRATQYLIKPYIAGLELNPLTSVGFGQLTYPVQALRKKAK